MMRTKKATLLLPTILASVGWVAKAQITIEEDDVFFDC